MHIDQKRHKIEGNQLLYKNGAKWLVRETLPKAKKNKDKRIKELIKKVRFGK